MQTVRWIVAATVFIALLFLSLQNADTVTLRFYNVASWEAPLIFVVLIAFAAGVAAGLLAGALRASRLKRQLSKLRRAQGQVNTLSPATTTGATSSASYGGGNRLPDGL